MLDTLAAFVSRWYADPLSPEDGLSDAELRAVEARLGIPLPGVLRAWFGAVGHRLADVQDRPVRAHELRVEAGALRLWIENQGNWELWCDAAGDDPPCRVVGDDDRGSGRPTSEALLGMLVSDTLAGAWSGRGHGPLGPLRDGVLGGFLLHPAPAQEVRARSLPDLPWWCNPFFSEPLRGGEDVVVRVCDVSVEWMTATDAAYPALRDALDLEPPGGLHVLYVSVEDHAAVVSFGFMQDVVADRAHIGMTWGARGGAVGWRMETRDPGGLAAYIVARLPPEVRRCAVIAHHPAAVARFQVLYPPGRTKFSPPG